MTETINLSRYLKGREIARYTIHPTLERINRGFWTTRKPTKTMLRP